MTTIKLARRLAERLLENEDCRIIIEQCHPTEIFTTRAGINENNEVLVPSEHILVPITDITRIEYTNRFGCTSMMEIDWE